MASSRNSPLRYALLAAALLFANAAHANGLPGQRLEQIVGKYVIDVGTDAVDKPIIGEPVQFDFAPLDAATRAVIPYATMTLTLTANGATVFDGDLIAAPAGPTLFTYVFPEPGAYALTVEFFDDHAKSIVRGTLPVIHIVQNGNVGGDSGAGASANDLRQAGTAPYAMQQELNGNQLIAEVMTDQIAAPTSHRPIALSFGLQTNVGNKPVRFTDADVIILRDNIMYLHADAAASNGGVPRFSYAFPIGSDYKMIVDYYDGINKLGEAQFTDFVIAPASADEARMGASGNPFTPARLIAGAAFLIIFAFAVRYLRSAPPS